MNYKKINIEKRRNIINLIKQNNYEIDCKLLNNICRLDYLFIYQHMMIPLYCDNDNVYGRLFIDDNTFVVKFKDNQSINISFESIPTRKDYNLDYNEENFIVNNHSFTIVYDYKANGNNNFAIVDKNSRKLLIVIDRKRSVINVDIFKLFNKSIYKYYENNQKWIDNNARLLPPELNSVITKCQVLIALSS